MRGLIFVLLARAAAADPAAVDVSAVRDRLAVWSDGKKHFLALVMTSKFDSPIFWSHDGKSFYQQRVTSGANDGFDDDLKMLARNFWEPRGLGFSAEAGFDYRKEERKLVVECGSRKTTMERLDDAAARDLLSAASFKASLWDRYAYALARDDTGRYYYVDNLRESKNFRLFAGPRGALKLLKMTNVVSDSEGDIFSTAKGDLRLILSKKESTWIVRQKHTRLVWLPVDDNRALIYNDLGVYSGMPLGTPCDDL
jgi:hypothetical protein